MKISKKVLKQIIHEELSKTDIKEIEQIAKKAAKKETDEQIKKFIKEELQKELEKAFKDKKSRDEIVEVVKKVTKKFYHDLTFNYSYFIDRIKL